LQKGLTQITRISWVHAKPGPLATIKDAAGGQGHGVWIEFNRAVQMSHPKAGPIDSDHVFEVLVRQPKSPVLSPWTGVLGKVVAVDLTGSVPQEITTPTSTAIAFIVDGNAAGFLNQWRDVLVRLRGDFVLDVNDKAVSAEFVRAQLRTSALPAVGGTGEQPAGSGLCLQGATFESWFTLRQE
jgi:hypothetical protein